MYRDFEANYTITIDITNTGMHVSKQQKITKTI